MSSISESLRTFLIDIPAVVELVGYRVFQNTVPQGQGLPYIWFRRGTTDDGEVETLDMNNDAPALAAASFRETFDLELVGDETDIDDVDTLADAMKQRGVNYYRGTFGDGAVQGVYVEDQNDTYKPTNDSGDEGRHIAALELQVVGYEE